MEQPVTVTFAGSGDAFGSGGRYQACIHVRAQGQAPFLVDCGATSLTALKAAGLDPGEIGTVFVKVIACTGDTAWNGALPAVAAGADLLIAEAYYFSKAIPYHLSFADLAAHRDELACRRVVLTHMSADMLARGDQPGFRTAW